MKTYRRIMLLVGLLVLVVVLGAFAWADRQLNRSAGALTAVVDRTRFSIPPERLVISHVNVLSPDGTAMLADRTVLVDRGRIVSIAESGGAPASWGTGTRLIDGSGRWLVPGFIDSHVHLRSSPNDLLLYVANGVTGVVEMSGESHQLAWRKQIEEGVLGPTMFVASRKLGTWGRLEGWYQAWTRRRINVADPADTAGAVADLKREGFDAVKVGSFVDANTYGALSLAADAADMRLIGHIPLSVSLQDVCASSQQQVGHLEELVKALNFEFGPFNADTADDFLAFVRTRAPEVAECLRTQGIAVSTTLWLVDSIPRQKLDLDALLDEVPLEYANPGLIEGTPLSRGWLPSNNPYGIDPDASPADREAIRRHGSANTEAHRIVLRALVDAGVAVMAGTDADNAVVVPGFSLHDEMRTLTHAGLSNAQSLRTATATAGDWLGNRTGRIQPGYRADLVLLAGNPLDSIGNTSRIDMVILGGRVLDRAALDAMLAAVRHANDASRTQRLERKGAAQRHGSG